MKFFKRKNRAPLSKMGRIGVIATAVFIVLALGMLITISFQRVSFYAVQGDSMSPALENRQGLVLRQERDIDRGFIIVFRKPQMWDDYTFSDGHLIKRVRALPGDTVTFDGRFITVNGTNIFDLNANNYDCEIPSDYSHTLADDEVFAVGDNFTKSLDSLRMLCDGNPDKAYIHPRTVRDYGRIVVKF